VREADDGKALLKCHAGCDFSKIVEAMGLEEKDLFSENGHHTGKSEIVATYDYTDADRVLLFQTVRKQPKDFRQRRPDSAGGWIWSLGDTPRVLYHLPEILEADPEKWVFVCEGEKSADAVRSLGLIATTSPMGAGKWRHCDQTPLEGRKVAVLPDRDPEGQNHALDVVDSLKGIAAARRIVSLPEVTRKSDPADWIAAGGTKKDLLGLLEEADDVDDTPLFWDGEGHPKTADFVAALESLGYRFRLNVCNDQVEVNGEPMSDVKRSEIKSKMRDLGYRQTNVMEDAWIAHAAENSYHPVRQWLNGLKWDGRDHIHELSQYFDDELGFWPIFSRRWLIGAVARACEPHSCQNRMLVMDGAQGIGKSYWARWLASPIDRPELYIEGPINPEQKDDLIRLITAWVWEVSELGSTTRRADRESLKYFLSLQQVTVRKPYGRYDLVKPALASFVGTVNNVGGFLDDPTGYRRFMTVNLRGIDWDYSTAIDPSQLWAQAKTLYDAGEPWELNTEEAEMAAYANGQYEVADPLADLIQRFFEETGDPSDFVSVVDVRDTLNLNGWRLNKPRAEAMAIADVMKGWDGATSDRVSVNGNRERGYRGVRRRP
jgi:predicted P-loop ATPase